jgi:cytochrome c2
MKSDEFMGIGWVRGAFWLLFLLSLLFVNGCTQPQPKPLYEIPGGDVDRGRQAMTEYGCTACHVIPGVTNADANVGPSLAGWAKRGSIAGKFPNTPEVLVAWIQEPQRMAPGSIMPDVGVPEEVARDMSLYLYTLRRNPSQVPWQ